ncbi:guanine deaminase [Chromatiales bacterium (ex Bugula neritina AB1)]|nr:guanine deaminase [Chromatiales bacterium (ex Bugula neritina AB1)]
MPVSKDKLIRGTIVHLTADPSVAGADALEVVEDGALLIRDGRIAAVDGAKTLLAKPDCQQATQYDYRGCYIFPGFIDTHVHYPQVDMIASYGAQLLEWLERYTFPAEIKFSDPVHAAGVADFALSQLFRNGTTTAMMFATVHPISVDAIFEAASRCNMRMITGKVMMDRNCPEKLRDTAEQSYRDSQALIDRWHGTQRLNYAITPRFAPTSSEKQLELAGRLYADNPGVYVQSHVAENQSEVKWVAELYPWSRSYLDVYDHYGLLGDRAVYAHCIHLTSEDLIRMRETQTVAAFCPTSNLFLGSGLFDLNVARESGVRTGMATDVGGGTSFNMLETASEAYKVTQLNGNTVNALQLLYEITLGGARALSLQQHIGNFETGKEADFVVLDPQASELLGRRIELVDTIEEKLFALIMLADDRLTRATHLMGERVYSS